jgi:hypothetical protein
MQARDVGESLLHHPVDAGPGKTRADVARHRQVMHDIAEGGGFDEEDRAHAVACAGLSFRMCA